MTFLTQILAEGEAVSGPSPMSTFLPMLAVMGIFYFLLIRPQQKARKQQEAMRSKLSKNDKVITESGIHGIITGLSDKTVTLKISEGVSIKLERFAIARVLSESKATEASE